MAFKNCIYCSTPISEFAKSCPKCHSSAPFDVKKKREYDFQEKGRKKLDEFIKCNECGQPIKISKILQDKRFKECPKCGFPDNKIACFVCGNDARYYDPYQENFTCFDHMTENCQSCGKLVKGINKKVEYGFKSRTSLCESCYASKQSSEFWRSFPVDFILRPLGFGIVFFFLIGSAGFIIRIVLGHNFFKSISNAISIEGIIGFLFGAIWAIIKRESFD